LIPCYFYPFILIKCSIAATNEYGLIIRKEEKKKLIETPLTVSLKQQKGKHIKAVKDFV